LYGEILKQGWASEEKKRHYYDFIYDESERLSRLINNVLQLARMNRNEQDPELSTYNVAGVVREIQAKVTSQVEAASFKLTVTLDTNTEQSNVEIDQDWLTQIMINLFDNAIKFSAKTKRKEVILHVRLENNKRVLFTVSDFGPGIEKQQMKAIFKLFYRTENELTRDTVGTGIGLSLVKQLVTGMGGEVTVQNRIALNSETNKLIGADFTVSFPSIKQALQ
jgi:signal transduction histidine kinase